MFSRKKKYFLGLLFLILLSLESKSDASIQIKQGELSYDLTGNVIQYLEDKSAIVNISDILHTKVGLDFKPMSSSSVELLEANMVYWLKIDIRNLDSASVREWILEFFDFRINSLDMYIPQQDGQYLHKSVGFSYPHSQKEFKHKNYAFQLPYLGTGVTHIYARVISDVPVTARARLSKTYYFNDYALNEYYILSLYYGICLAMIVYNLFLYFTIRDVTYLYYILYVLGATLFSFSRDGLGFHFLWPQWPILNKYMFSISNVFMISWEVMYARSFLNTKNTQPIIDKALQWALALRITIFFVTLFILPSHSNDITFDIIILALLFYSGYKVAKKKYLPANYYLIAFTCMLVGYFVFNLFNRGIVPHNVLTEYSVNFGIVGEMLLLSFALASRIKILQKEKIDAQHETIKQLTLNEELKDSANRELEQKVWERTKELETKNKELDAFVYKASHDLKGPLNSIVGLATIGMMENDMTKAREYFKHTCDTAKRLQATIVDLLSLTKVKETIVNKHPVDISLLLDEVIENFAHDENYAEVGITKKIDADKQVVTDEGLIRSILQNLVENGLKYRDPKKEKQTLDISLKNKNGHFVVKVSDNGIGIPDNSKDKVFEMFYKINPKSNGSGLGLHILKTAVQKLGGNIELETQWGKGSTFMIELPNDY
jgi:signal transduction histidine kinase